MSRALARAATIISSRIEVDHLCWRFISCAIRTSSSLVQGSIASAAPDMKRIWKLLKSSRMHQSEIELQLNNSRTLTGSHRR